MTKQTTLEERFAKTFLLFEAGDIRVNKTREEYLDFIKQEIRSARERRDGELIIMMNEAEAKGWDFNRFINTFSAMYQSKHGE